MKCMAFRSGQIVNSQNHSNFMVKHSYGQDRYFSWSDLTNFLGSTKCLCQSPFHLKILCSKPIPFQRQNFILNSIPFQSYGQTCSIPTTWSAQPQKLARLLPNCWIMDLPVWASSHWEALQRHYFTDDLGLAERLVERSKECAEVLSPVQQFGSVGHPRYRIDEQQIKAMIELGCSYEQMAAILGISSRTLRRCRSEYGFPMGRN